MPDWLQLALAAIGGGSMSAIATIAVQWLRSSGDRHATDRTVDAQLEEHWTEATLQLIETLRTELNAAKAELASLPSIVARAAHLDEALDHLQQLIQARKSNSAAEIEAAERRAEAFLRRMRSSDRIGEARQAAQRDISAARVNRDKAAKHKD